MTIAGIPGRALEAGQRDLKRVLGVPIPELRHTLAKDGKLAAPQSMEIPMPPTTAITGVALMMKRPADHAMYVAIMVQRPSRVSSDLFFLLPLHNSKNAQPIAIKATMGPYDANRTPRSGAWASPMVPKILFLEK